MMGNYHARCGVGEKPEVVTPEAYLSLFGQIPKFEKLIATIRSREISASIILQSQSQLKAIYKDNADTIVGNCDTTLFLGGKEKTTLTRQQVGTVERALKIFMKLGLVEPLPSGALYMSNIELLIGQSSTEGERKRRARLALQEQKALPQTGADKCPPYRADICPPEIEIEKWEDRRTSIYGIVHCRSPRLQG